MEGTKKCDPKNQNFVTWYTFRDWNYVSRSHHVSLLKKKRTPVRNRPHTSQIRINYSYFLMAQSWWSMGFPTKRTYRLACTTIHSVLLILWHWQECLSRMTYHTMSSPMSFVGHDRHSLSTTYMMMEYRLFLITAPICPRQSKLRSIRRWPWVIVSSDSTNFKKGRY